MANRSKGDRHTTVIRLPSRLYEKLATEAQQRGISLNDYMLGLITRGRAEQVLGHEPLRTAEQSISGYTQLQS